MLCPAGHPVTTDELEHWFRSHGWWVRNRQPMSLAFATGQGVPEGMTRVLAMRGTGQQWTVFGFLEVRDEVEQLPRTGVIASVDDIPVVVSSFGPTSFQHRIAPFAAAQGLQVVA